MNIVFLNQFERMTAHVQECAHVYIGEHQGVWSAGWRLIESTATMGTAEEELEQQWYEGMSWEELLASFRYGVAAKMRDGFRPLLDGMLEETPFWELKPGVPQLLQCYADMQQVNEIVEKLRVWRRSKATLEKKSAFLVATNRELQLLAVYLPQSMEELLQIPGYGKAKAENYGEELFELLKGMERTPQYPLADWVSKEVTAEQISEWEFRMKEEKYGKARQAILEKRTLLFGIREGQTLEQLEQSLQCPRRSLVERIEKLDEEGYDVLPIVDMEVSTLPDDERFQIEAAMSELGDRYLKPLLRKVYGDAKGNDQETERQYEKLRMMRIRFRRVSRMAI